MNVFMAVADEQRVESARMSLGVLRAVRGEGVRVCGGECFETGLPWPDEPLRLESGGDGAAVWREMFGRVELGPSEHVHLAPPGTVVLPGFYEAARTMLEADRLDYVVGTRVVARDDAHVADGLNFAVLSMSQVVVCSWALDELGVQGSLEDTARKLVSEYRGDVLSCPVVVEVADG